MLKTIVVSVALLATLVLGGCAEFKWITPEPVVEVVVPAEEVGEVVPDPEPAPPCVIVKGNISRNGNKIAHLPGQANYDQVKIDEEAGEKFFCSLEEAEAEGWRAAQR